MSFRFLNFKIYQDSKVFYKKVQEMIKEFPAEEKFALGDQLRRSSLSIILNIAEGSDKGSDKDFARFLKTALGSLNETVAGIDVAYGNKYIGKDKFERLLALADALSKQLASFGRRLASG